MSWARQAARQRSKLHAAALIALMWGCRSAPCSNQVVSATPSPGNELTAVVFLRHCEGKSPSAQVSILPAGRTLPNESANVFIATTQNENPPAGKGPLVTVEWFGRNRLRITHERTARIHKQRRNEAAVVIQYVSDS